MIFRLAQFHEHEELLRAAQTRWGAAVLWCAAVGLLVWHDSNLWMLAALTLVMLYPASKRLFLSLAAVGMIVEGALKRTHLGATGMTDLFPWLLLMGRVAMVLGLLYLAYLAALRFKQWPALIRRYPLLTLHGGIWLGLMLTPWLGVFGRLPFLAWRLSYLVALARRDKAAGTRFHDHLFYLMPVFGGTSTPYGKGLDFLSRHEARDPDAFARSQLAGIKLLVLATLWIYLLDVMDVLVFGQASQRLPAQFESWSLGLPRLVELLQAGVGPTWYQGWAVLYLELIRATLALAALGHVIIGSLRLLGFNVFRNTYKPLLAESILEFWNRYYYYFKELLVDFFFYPTYLKLRSASPRLRLFLAVFAAAFLGNMYYHVLTQPEPVIVLDVALLWATWGPRLVYCFLLAFGIWVSMLREQQKRRVGAGATLPVRLRRIAGVWTFYAVIEIWSTQSPEAGFLERAAFLASLFAL
jgi:hypothetical protein